MPPKQQTPTPAKKKTDGNFDTPLTPVEEREFIAWIMKYRPKELEYVDAPDNDYDYRGAYKAFKSNEEGFRHEDLVKDHWDDRYKKPNHPTFSNKSIYRHYGKPGRWENEKYIPYEEPSPWNPFAGGVNSPVGKGIGAATDAGNALGAKAGQTIDQMLSEVGEFLDRFKNVPIQPGTQPNTSGYEPESLQGLPADKVKALIDIEKEARK